MRKRGGGQEEEEEEKEEEENELEEEEETSWNPPGIQCPFRGPSWASRGPLGDLSGASQSLRR